MYSGITFVFFHKLGTRLFSIDRLKNLVREGTIEELAFFNIRGEVISKPDAFEVSIHFKRSLTSSLVTMIIDRLWSQFELSFLSIGSVTLYHQYLNNLKKGH